MTSSAQVCSEPDFAAHARLDPLTEHLCWRFIMCLEARTIAQIVPLNRDIRDIAGSIAKTILAFCEEPFVAEEEPPPPEGRPFFA